MPELLSYIGVKLVKAKAMTRGEYAEFTLTYKGGFSKLDCDVDSQDREGYIIYYPQVNPDELHYVAWCPKAEFEKANRRTDGMPFGYAIEAARKGHKIARAGWNGKGMFVVYMEPMYLPPFNSQEPGKKVNDRTAKFIGEDQPLDCQPYFAMYNAQKQWIPGWLASQSDMLADDWMVVD